MRTPLLVALVAGLAHAEPGPQNAADKPQLDVVFVLDTTSSMGGLIEGAKEKIWSIASRMASGKPTPRIRVGLVAFRDRGDAYVTRRFDLTTDLDSVYRNLHALQAEGGGDGPEHVGRALGEAVKLMQWNEGPRTAKLIFLVGDAPPHDDYRDGFKLADMARLAIGRRMVVNAIRCGTDGTTEKAFREVAHLADGTFTTIGQSGDMVAVATPLDSKLEELDGALAEKSLYGGSAGGRAAGEATKRELDALSTSSTADRLSFRAKVGGKRMAPAAVTSAGGIDLVLEPWKVEALGDDELPDAVRRVKPAERRAWLERQRAERFDLEADVGRLARERDAWLAKHAAEQGDSFDATVMKKVKETAATVGVEY